MEKYGEVPARFTKAWWGYFWDYYKWHVIITLGTLLIAAVTITQCVTRPRYDMTLIYAGHKNYSETEREKLCSLAEDYIPDIDENGKTVVNLQPLVITGVQGNEDYDAAVRTKLDLTFLDDNTYIYLMDEIEASFFMDNFNIAETFENTDLYAADTNAGIMRGNNDGIGYAVSLKNSEMLRDNEIYCEDLYLMVRVDDKADEKNIASHNRAMEFAKALVR